MNARKKSIGILTAMFGLTMCFAIPTAISASAAETTETPATTITMEKGASLKLDKVSGLKFTATVENAKEGANYGMLILPYDYFADAEVNITDSTDYVTAFTSARADGDIARDPILAQNLPVVDGKISYSIHNVLENNYDREFFGIAFEKTSTEAGDTYTYATYNDNVRSIMEVASGALNAYNYEKASLSEDLIATYEANMDLLNSFVDTGVSNVIGTAEDATLDYAIEGANEATLYNDLTLSLNMTIGVHLQNVWSSSDETVATVENGVLVPLKEGKTTISVKSAGKYSAEKEITVRKMTATETLDALYALKDKESLKGTHTLTGLVTAVTTPYTATNNYVTVVMVVEDKTEQPVTCYKMVGTGIDTVKAGDTITVTGTLKNYKGTYEFDSGCTLDKLVVGEEIKSEELTILEALDLGASKETGAYTSEKYYVSGVVESITNTMYGNLYIADDAGNKILLYGVYSADGIVRYDAMTAAEKPLVGDTIRVLGVVGNHNGTAQLKDTWLQELTVAEENKAQKAIDELTALIPTTVSEDIDPIDLYTVSKIHNDTLITWSDKVTDENSADTQAAKIEGGKLTFVRQAADATVKVSATIQCGSASKTFEATVKVVGTETVVVPTETTTISFTGTDTNKAETVTFTSGDVTLKFFNENSDTNLPNKVSGHMRWYKSDSLTITLAEGCKIKSVAFAVTGGSNYGTASNVVFDDGVATLDGNTLTLTTEVNSIKFTNNKQIRVTSIVVTYVAA